MNNLLESEKIDHAKSFLLIKYAGIFDDFDILPQYEIIGGQWFEFFNIICYKNTWAVFELARHSSSVQAAWTTAQTDSSWFETFD